jgi:hypothetical protein
MLSSDYTLLPNRYLLARQTNTLISLSGSQKTTTVITGRRLSYLWRPFHRHEMFYVRPTGAVKPLKDPKMEDNVKILKMRKNSFNWSLEPITKCMHVMGVSIPPSSEEVKSCRPMCHFYHTFCFLLVSFLQFILVIQVFCDAKSIANSYIRMESLPRPSRGISLSTI